MGYLFNPFTGNFDNSGAAVGDVQGPASSTDNAIARFDSTTGKLIQNSGVIIDDLNGITGPTSIALIGVSGGPAVVAYVQPASTGSDANNVFEIRTKAGAGTIAMTGSGIVYLTSVDQGVWKAEDIRSSTYIRAGSSSAPVNTTAGDITGVRLNIGNVAFGTGVEAAISGDATISGFLRVGSGTAPANTTAGDLTFVRGFGGDTVITSVTTGLSISAGATYALQLSSTAGTAAGGITFGTDATLYRSAADTLTTDDAVIVSQTSDPTTAVSVTGTNASSVNNARSIKVDTIFTGSGLGSAGIEAAPIHRPSVSVGSLYGLINIAKGGPPVGVTITNLYGGAYRTDSENAAGVITNAIAMVALAPSYNTLVPTSSKGVRVENAGAAGITNVIGIELLGQTKGTTITTGIRINRPSAGTGITTQTHVHGIDLLTESITFGDQTATSTNVHGIRIGIPTYTSTTNVRTMTNVANLYIEGAPVASTNITVTNGPYSVWVDAGTSRFDGLVETQTAISIKTGISGNGTINSNVAGNDWGIFRDTSNSNNLVLAEKTGSTTTSRFAFDHTGHLGIGVLTSLTGLIHIAAGTTAAGTAPIKLTSGPLLTAAEAGAVEFLTDAYYGTITTGAVRGMFGLYQTGRSTAQTAAVASVLAYTLPATDGSFIISANVLVTTATTHSFNVTVAYTDEGNTARTVTLNFSTLAGVISNAAITNVGGAVPYEGVPIRIRCKASTAITIATTGTFTAVTYNVEGSITQVA